MRVVAPRPVRKSETRSTPARSGAAGLTTFPVSASTAAAAVPSSVKTDGTAGWTITLVVNDPLPVTTVNFAIPGAPSGQIIFELSRADVLDRCGDAVDCYLHVPQRGG